MTFAPTGRQIHLAAGPYAADVVEVAAGLRTLTHGGRALVAGFGAEEAPAAGRGITLVPWPGRIDQGRYTWEGSVHQLAWSEPALRNAIHGLLRYTPWDVVEVQESSVELLGRIMPQRGYPFAIECRMHYQIDADTGLTVTASATNVGDVAAPFAFGSHPYLSVGTASVDECVATVPAATALVVDDRLLPTATVAVEEAGIDFRAGRVVGDQQINTCVTDLDRDSDGLAWSSLAGPDGTATYLWADAEFGYAVLYTMDVPVGGRQGFAIEPQTSPPNAFATGEDVIRLEPGARWQGRYGFRVDRP